VGAALAWAEVLDGPVFCVVLLALLARLRRQDRRLERLLAALVRHGVRLERLEEGGGGTTALVGGEAA